MSETTRNFAVGGFVVASLLVLAMLMAWFGETPDWLGGNEWPLQIVGIRDLRGIAPGCPVQLNGVEIGRVKELQFADSDRPDLGVIVVTRINNKYGVPEGAHARLYGATLGFGTGRIELVVEPGAERLLPKDGASIGGEMRSVIGEFITKEMVDSVQRTVTNIGDLAGEATPVAKNLANLLEQRPVSEVGKPGTAVMANVTTVVERLDELIANLNAVLGDVNVQGDVKTVVRDLRDSAETLKQTVELWKESTQRTADNLNDGIDHTETNLDQSFAKLNAVLDNLDDGSKSLALTLNSIAEGRGTAGMLVRDERLYEAAVLSLQRFADAMATLNVILDKVERDGYVTVGQAPSGVLRKNIPTPAAQAGSAD